jgi:UDP-3-O-[3-hydroxymyristoyl] glucosamine N-acyltransferase
MKVYPMAKVSPRTHLVCDKDTEIGDFTFISCETLIMRRGACINRFCEVQGRGVVEMGEHSQVASHSTLVTSTDTPWGSMCDSVDEDKRRINTDNISIGRHAYIGPYVTIMPGVTIGERAVVGAYSYIASDVAPDVVIHPHIRLIAKPRRIDPRLYSFFDIQGVPDAEEYYEPEELMYEERVLEGEK